jgi:phospholipid/cholesterol/gamma-HCH transport system substrate-binding protein
MIGRRPNTTLIKFGIFVTTMTVMTVFLFMIFGDYRGGATSDYRAIFTDASDLKAGDSVRIAGVRVGTVTQVNLRSDNTALVGFDTDESTVLTTGSAVAVRYLNLVGDRYLELADGPGPPGVLPRGSTIRTDHTRPALDLDVLLGGLKPVLRGLDPRDVNALTSALLNIFQGQSDTMQSLLSRTSSFTTAMADNDRVIEEMITNLNAVLTTLGKEGEKFSDAIERFEKLLHGLATDRDPIGTAIDALDQGTLSLADLLSAARPPLAATVDQLNHLAPLINSQKSLIDAALQKAPNNFRKLARVGAYGSFVNYYLCGLSVRVTDLQGRTAQFPWIKQDQGRCGEP